MFWNIVLGLVSFALQIILTPKPQNAKPKALEDFELPTAEDGREIPVVFGSVDITGPNVTWYGDLQRKAIKGARRYGLFGPKQVLGYKYKLGVKMGLCHGPADAIYEIRAADKVAFEGVVTGGRINIHKGKLFGGDQSEGGIEGDVDIDMGAPDQLQNDYLVGVLGADVPAFRGVVNIILRRVYLGTSNYIKPWSFRLQRILLTSTGAAQWYPEKAAIGESSTFAPTVNQVVASSIGITLDDFAIDIKNGYVANAGGNRLQVWKYPDFDTPLWERTDAGSPQCVTIDDLGHIVVAYQNGTVARVYDASSGNELATISGMGAVSNAAITCRTIGDTTYIFQLENSTLFLASGSSIFAKIDQIDTGYGWLSQTQSFCASSENVYLAYNGFGVTSGARNKVKRVAWTGLGLSAAIETDLSSDLFGDIVVIAYMDDLDAVLIIDNDNGLHLYNPDLSTRLVFKHEHSDDHDLQWHLTSASHLLSNRIVAGDDLISFRAAGADVANVIVKYRINDLTLISVTKATDIPYVNASNSGYAYSGVDPDNDVMIVFGSDSSAPLAVWSLPPSAALDMNPAHIIRECLTDATWGMGYNASDIDDDTFTAAADTFYDEGFGLSLLWNQEEEIQEFVSTVLAHIDAYLYVSRETGKFVLKPIRDDYDIDAISVLTEDDVIEWTEVQHRSLSEAISRVQVKFYDRVNRQDASHAVTNLAQAMQATAVLSATREYPGISVRSLAIRVATRDARSLGAGMISGRLVAKRTIEGLNPGDPFRLVSSRHSLSGEVMRVGDLSFGDGRSNKITMKFVQDVFKLSAAVLIDDSGSEWTPPSSDPLPVSPRLVWEMPYREGRQMVGDSDLGTMLAANADAGLLQVAGSAPTSDAYQATVRVDSGAGYDGAEAMNFAPGAFLSADLAIDATTIAVSGAVDFDDAIVGTLAAIIGSTPATTEIVRIDSVSDASLTIARGFLDTVPQAHATGAAIVFFDDFSTSDFGQYTAAATIAVKLLTATGSGELDQGIAPINTVTFASRAIRPLRPANVQVEGDGYGPVEGASLTDFEVSCAERNRLIELDPAPSWTDATEAPEAGQTIVIEVLDPAGSSVVTTHSGLTIADIPYSVPLASFSGNSSGFVRVGAERDGYREWQAHKIEVLVGYGLVLDSIPLTLDGETLFLGA